MKSHTFIVYMHIHYSPLRVVVQAKTQDEAKEKTKLNYPAYTIVQIDPITFIK